MGFKCCALVILMLPIIGEAATSEVGKITRLVAYSDYQDGDVILFHNTGIEQCPNGGYRSPADPGYKVLVSFALSAYAASMNVRFQLKVDNIWNGSSAVALCRIRTVDFVNN